MQLFGRSSVSQNSEADIEPFSFEDYQFSQNENVVAAAVGQHNVPPPIRRNTHNVTASRKRYLYRKRKIIGKHTLFLNPAYLRQFREKYDENFELQGKVVH